MFHEKIQPGTLVSLMLYTLNLAMCFAFLSNVYGEFMQVRLVIIICLMLDAILILFFRLWGHQFAYLNCWIVRVKSVMVM